MADPSDRTAYADRTDLDATLSALADPDCRRILAATETPRTATEIVERCGIPLSTVYRKLDALRRTPLLDETVRLRSHGKNPAQFECQVGRVHIDVSAGADSPEETMRAVIGPERADVDVSPDTA